MVKKQTKIVNYLDLTMSLTFLLIYLLYILRLPTDEDHCFVGEHALILLSNIYMVNLRTILEKVFCFLA